MLTFVKQTLQPGSLPVLLVLVTIGVALLYAGSRLARQGRRWLTAVLIGYWILSSPLGAALLARTLTGTYGPLASPADAPGVQAVVMLGGGGKTIQSAGTRLALMTTPTALRVLETVRVYRLLGNPLVIVSGGITEKSTFALPESDAVKTAVVALGVPADRVVVEAESKNTREEALVIKRMLDERRIRSFVMVTSPLHMRRSLAVFAAQGLRAVPSASALYGDRPSSPFALMPSDSALEIGSSVIYEWSALAYYWFRGWL